MTPLKVLLVEDEANDADLITRELAAAGFEPQVTRVEAEAQYVAHLREGIDIVLSDYHLPVFDGFRALELCVRLGLEIPFIFVSGAIGEEAAIRALKRGAWDYVSKDRLGRLGPVVQRSLAESRSRRERRQADEAREKAEAALHASEARFLRAQRMEAIGMLSGGIAHDLNNILTPILMGADLMSSRMIDDRDRDMIGIIQQAARRGGGLIRQLLAFSQGAAGDNAKVQLRHLVKETAGIMTETFPRSIVIDAVADADLRPVAGSATQLHQVIMNLCVNARDAMPQGGKLTVEASNIEVSAQQAEKHPPAKPGPFVALTVRDTGHGIPPEIAETIFEPFFTTKPQGKGTGLGLFTVQSIVREHGGFVLLKSEPGRGADFSVYLPAAEDGMPAEQEGGGESLPAGSGELVLVVDDEDPIRTSTQITLEQGGYRTLVAADGVEALSLFLKHRDDVRLVLTDVMMPAMGGITLIRALHAAEPKLGILVASGLIDLETKAELAAAGVDGLIEKPCGPREILAAVGRLLRKE